MASGQTIVENGRVGLLFKSIWTIATAVITTAIIGIFVKMDNFTEAQNATQLDVREIKSELRAQSTISNLNNETAKDERAKLDRRLTELERERRSRNRDDSREQ